MEDKALCDICTKAKVFTKCLGCAVSLCEGCACFELIGSGCGCVWPAYYCFACVHDPHINPNAVFKESDK
ncbi:MAG TPA: hypothetical protein VFG29_02840 [Syntrophales bacterium]|nr:hypothetical protein [Syntrophales bacterium]